MDPTEQLNRLAEGIKAAHAAGNAEHVKVLGAEYRRLQAQMADQSTAPQTTPEAPKDTSFTSAFTSGVDAPLEAIGTTAEALGFGDTGQYLKGMTEAPKNYDPASSHLKPDPNSAWYNPLSYDLSYLPRATMEQAGQFAGSVASRVAGMGVGAALGGAGGSVVPGVGTAAGAATGAAAGAFAGPALFEAAQILGPSAIARAKNNGRTTPNAEDWAASAATASASGALNAIGPGASGIIKRMLVEGGTEFAQSIVQQTGETLGTDKGLSVDMGQAVSEGLMGAGSAGVVDAPLAALHAASHVASRTDNREFTPDERRAAERIQIAADGQKAILGNVSDTGEGTAKGAAKAALSGIQAEVEEISANLKALAKGRDDRDAKIAVKAVVKDISKATPAVPDSMIENLLSSFPDDADAERLASLARQAQTIKGFTSDGTRDMGGFSRLTKNLDLTDKRNSLKLTTAAGLAQGIVKGSATIGGGILVNKFANLVDTLTNNRSRVKRFVDSALKNNNYADRIYGETALDTLQKMKDQKDQLAAQDKAKQIAQREAEKAAQKAQSIKDQRGLMAEQHQQRMDLQGQKQQFDLEMAAMKARQKLDGNSQVRGAKPALDQSKVDAGVDKNADLYKLNANNTAQMFETGVIPDDPIFKGYKLWNQRTGLSPEDTLSTLEQLEREGTAPKGSAQRYAENIYSFKKDKTTIPLQEAVRQRANPDYKPKFDVGKNPEDVLKKYKATDFRPTTSRRKEKAIEGARRAKNLVADIEAADTSLSGDQYGALLNLKEAIDSPDKTREDRGRIVNEMLPYIFDGNEAVAELWKKKFAPLIAIGNEYRIERKPEADNAEQAAEKALEDKKKAAKKAKKVNEAKSASKRTKEVSKPAETIQPGTDPSPTETTVDKASEAKPTDPADKALKKLNASPEKPKQLSFDFNKEPEAAVAAVQDAVEPNIPQDKTAKKKLKLLDRVHDRMMQFKYAIARAAAGEEGLQAYINGLPKNSEGRVESLIYKNASDRLTVNQLSEHFSREHGVPIQEAVRIVSNALQGMEAQGKLKVISAKWNNKLKSDQKFVKDEEGNLLDVAQIEFTDPDMIDRIEDAKAVNQVSKMVNQNEAGWDYNPNRISQGAFKALKDIPKDRVDGSFTPLLGFINALRHMRTGVSNTILTQIEDALAGTGDKRLGTIYDELLPAVAGSDRRDEGPMRTVAQLLHQLGTKDERGDSTIRQEWSAGANGRVYSKNGLAHVQSGDIMKGIVRTPEKHKIGSQAGLDFVFHGIGNLLGYDKEAPATRRGVIFDRDMVDSLITFAEDPFGRSTMKKKDKFPTRVSQIVGDGEGFFQVLNAAHEVKNMVDWSRERHKGKAKLSNDELLQDPEVRADLAQNYETDFIVQLDASNNAYQIAGMLMGYEDVLKATGLMPPNDAVGDADTRKGADIYLGPAQAIEERIPEIKALALPRSKLRKVFKNAIGTYLYAAEFDSRKRTFAETLGDIAGDQDLFGINGDGLIPVPQNIIDGMKSKDGHLFEDDHYNVEGDVKETKRKRVRVFERDGKFGIETAEGLKGKFNSRKANFDTEEDAIKSVYALDLYKRMNQELIRDMNTRFPKMRSYLDYAQVVSQIVKDRGGKSVVVPTKDGMALEYSFKENPVFTGVDYKLSNGNMVSLGVRTEDVKLAGRGLAAFMAHQSDAWALRETFKRMPDLKFFNPIHDSYGFHPSDATKGQETWVQVMQELGADDYNLFQQILEANQISLGDFQAAGGDVGFILSRKGVKPVPAKQIPTALS